jgi:photosynthetic reaction center H subunit
MHSPLSESMDLAQVVLYVFWLFFFSLIFWLRREDRREGYPVELDSGMLTAVNPLLIPPAKEFVLPHNEGTVLAPNLSWQARSDIKAVATSPASGAPLEPVGDPLLSEVGPASWAQRADHPELTQDGRHAVVPLRVATDHTVHAGPDPRGFDVVGADGKVAGKVTDVWVDRADVQARYLEFTLAGEEGASSSRLIPVPMLRVLGETRKVEVYALLSSQFKHVPTLRNPDVITLLEEERVSAFYAGGRMYAAPSRLGPAL